MKTMTCKELGGACGKAFHADTFDEIAQISKEHGTEMFKKDDKEHIKAMKKMMELMQNPEDMQKWFDQKRENFESLPEE